jgi:hypothetical protein
VATHSGPMRAFATAAAGRDPGEPHNAEPVVVRVQPGVEVATVDYRDGSHELRVPDVEQVGPGGGEPGTRPGPRLLSPGGTTC